MKEHKSTYHAVLALSKVVLWGYWGATLTIATLHGQSQVKWACSNGVMNIIIIRCSCYCYYDWKGCETAIHVKPCKVDFSCSFTLWKLRMPYFESVLLNPWRGLDLCVWVSATWAIKQIPYSLVLLCSDLGLKLLLHLLQFCLTSAVETCRFVFSSYMTKPTPFAGL